MRIREWLAIIVGVGVAAGAWYGLRRLGPPPQPTVQVVVAARELSPYTEIRAEDVRFQVVPAAGVDPRVARDPNQVLGRMALTPILEGEPLYPQKLVQPDEVLQPGYRAVAIQTDLIAGIGGHIQPGALVDLHWIPKGGAEPGGVLVSGVLVLDVRTADNRPYRPTARGFGLTIGVGEQSLTAGTNAAPAVLVLRLPTSQVQAVLAAAARGQVVAALHPPTGAGLEEGGAGGNSAPEGEVPSGATGTPEGPGGWQGQASGANP